MSEESILEQARKKLEERRSKIKKEYENKIRELEERIEKNKTERDAKLAKSERRFRKELSVAIEIIVGREDLEWLIQWLVKAKETETKEAEKKHKKGRAEELKAMSPEDYLFLYLSDPKVGERLKGNVEAGKPEDIARFIDIESKLKLENIWLDGTLV